MIHADQYIVRVVRDGRLPDIELYVHGEQGIALSIEGIAGEGQRSSIARKIKDLFTRAFRTLHAHSPKAVVQNTISLVKQELALHLSKEIKEHRPAGAHTAVIKFAWDDRAGKVVAVGDADGGIKNFTFHNDALEPFQGVVHAEPGDIFLQCSPGLLRHLEAAMVRSILLRRKMQKLSLEDARKEIVASAYTSSVAFRYTPAHAPQDMSLVLLEMKESAERNVTDGEKETLVASTLRGEDSLRTFDFSDFILPIDTQREEALVTLQHIRNRLKTLGYIPRIKPHQYMELPVAGNLRTAVKRIYEILYREMVRESLRNDF